MRNRYALAALGICVCLASSTTTAEAGQGLLSEVRFGVYQHDTDLVGTNKESGIDLSLEALSQPLFTLSFASPRVVLGGVLNTEGQTNQIFLGLADQWDFAHAVISPGDALFLEGSIAADWHDGKLDVSGTPLESEWKSHGSRFLIRTGVDLGYRIDSTWSVAFSFNHISNGDLATKNEGMNDIGLHVGMRF
ncbi:MAG: acyloxyacyl hydrolase [Alphaproteobacteria bacterium]|nr:acyloxyacyl hydrolase [Alphaproteobacteria bacterium]